ncbi:MAG TPA: CvpA family protein [Leadbetterella sp.]|nr:CvpA family protein [Leadbetterella sp.]
MAIIDLILIVPVLLGAFNGYKKGLLVEVFGIAAFVLAIVIGFKFLSFGADFLEKIIGKENLVSVSPYISFFVVFLPTIFLLRKAGWMMRKAVRLTFLGTLDGLFGAFLGGFTALFGMSVFLWIFSKTGIDLPQKWMVDNQYFDFAKSFAPDMISKISNLIPGGNWIDYLKNIKTKILI